MRVVIHGAGAAGIRIAEMLKLSGARQVVLCDSKGVIRADRPGLSGKKKEHAARTSASTVGEALRGAHVLIGVSAADCIKPEQVAAMAEYPAIFAMANPDPEIRPEAVAQAMGKKPYVMATGRSDYPNQINNVLGFPFLFRGALDSRARRINLEMKTAAAKALAAVARQPVAQQVLDLFPDEGHFEFGRNYIVPKPFDARLFVEVSYAVAEAAVKSAAAKAMDLPAYRRELERRNRERMG